jgi:hypothetical protein
MGAPFGKAGAVLSISGDRQASFRPHIEGIEV